MRHADENGLRAADDDGLPAPEVGPWAEEKYRRLGMYAEMFSTGMKNKWETRVYLDLFAGSGHAILRNSRRRVLTSPLLALDVKDPFDLYVFCEQRRERLDALKLRATRMRPGADVVYDCGDANEVVDALETAMPRHSTSNRVLSFCFIDPYGLDIHFDTVRKLGEGRAMDFLILLASDMDGRRNWATYVRDDSQRIDQFLGDDSWRERWRIAESNRIKPARFLAEEYQSAMERIGYVKPGLLRMIPVKVPDNNMRLYYLAFFSRNERGYHFWDEVRKYSTDQLGLL